MSLPDIDTFIKLFRRDYRNGPEYAVYTPTPHIHGLIDRMEKAEAELARAHKFIFDHYPDNFKAWSVKHERI